VAGFADALARLALNRELLIEAGAAARRLWESRYSVEAAAARLADVYERVSA
jgi:glycosyltransferase involved in cell wall biosynthesis